MLHEHEQQPEFDHANNASQTREPSSPDCRESPGAAASSVESCIIPIESPSTSDEAMYFMLSSFNGSEYEAEGGQIRAEELATRLQHRQTACTVTMLPANHATGRAKDHGQFWAPAVCLSNELDNDHTNDVTEALKKIAYSIYTFKQIA